MDEKNLNPPSLDFLRPITHKIQNIFKERLIACYSFGSLARGGFRPEISDIDIAIILASPLQEKQDQESVAHATAEIIHLNPALGRKLSLFWTSLDLLQSKSAHGGRFPLLDRLDLVNDGILLTGKDIRKEIALPNKEEIDIEIAEFVLHDLAEENMTHLITNPKALIAAGLTYTTKLILFPARFLYTLQTGKVGHNQEAATYFIEKHHNQLGELVKNAFSWRNGALFNEEQALNLISANLIPLYKEFIESCSLIIQSHGRKQLAHQLDKWEDHLIKK